MTRERLRKAIKKNGSIKSFAEKNGFNRTRIFNIISGIYVSKSDMEKIANALNKSPRYLFGADYKEDA